jgi:fibro-slime domain-containing protein
LLLSLRGLSRAQKVGDTTRLTCTVRDIGFGGAGTKETGDKEGPHHPDFGTFVVEDKGIVEESLGADDKPVYAGPATGTVASSGPANFYWWYNTDTRTTGDGVCGASEECPRNLELKHDIVLSYNGADWSFSSDNFFIVDKKGWQPTTTGYAHNWHFTVECAMQFTYVAGDTFYFRGDDDVWVFINRKRAINLGGTHGPLAASVNLDSKATELGIAPGGTYSMHLFYAERHAIGSSFLMTTNIALTTCPGFWNEWEACDKSTNTQIKRYTPDAGLTPKEIAVCPTPKNRTCRSSCAGAIDVFICLDMSGSLDNAEYQKQQMFASDFVNEFTDDGNHMTGGQGIKIGVMGFASSTKRFTETPMLSADYATVRSAINAPRTSGGTKTELCFGNAGYAFDLATENDQYMTTFSWGSSANNQGARDAVPKIVLLLTDGEPTSQTTAVAASQAALSAGVTIVGVGVGVPNGGDAKIKDMVSSPVDDHYVSVDDFAKLQEKLASIVHKVCIVSCKGVWLPWSACDQDTGTQHHYFNVTDPGDEEGDSCPTYENRTCPVHCKSHYEPWPNITCTSATTETQPTIVDIAPKNGGQACPPDNERECTPCAFTWVPWAPATCNVEVTQTQKAVVTVTPKHGGEACPADKNRTCMPCAFTWGPWEPATCQSATVQTQRAAVTVQPQNGGAACPADNTRTCSPCVFAWTNWTVCDITSGRQSRKAVIIATPVHGGTPCPPSEERTCPIPCQFTWSEWVCDKYTGKKTRRPVISAQPLNGGGACPPTEVADCLVNCEGSWKCWSACTTPNALQPPFKKYRDFETVLPSKNGGVPCPPRQTKPCLPDVCYSAESSAPSFGDMKKDMVPFRTLPPHHPALTRTDCGGPFVADASGRGIPAVNASSPAICSGPAMWYALDPATGKSGSGLADGKDGVSQVFFLQDADGWLHLGMLNGAPTTTLGTASSAAYTFSFRQLSVAVANLGWEVQNDVPVDTTANCNPSAGTDCYLYLRNVKRAQAQWSWMPNTNAGGVLGPLQSYEFCVDIRAGDVKGIDAYEFASDDSVALSGSGSRYSRAVPFTGNVFDYGGVKVCTYECKRPQACADPGDSVWSNTAQDGGSGSGGDDGDGGGGDGSGGGNSGAGSGGSATGGSPGMGTSESGSASSSSSSSSDASNSANGKDASGASASGGGLDIAVSRDAGNSSMAGSEEAGMSLGALVGIGGGGFLFLLIVVVLLAKRWRKDKGEKVAVATNVHLPAGWTMFTDPGSGHPCYESPDGKTQWDPPKSIELATVEMNVENPMRERGIETGGGHHARQSTTLPRGWDKDTTEEGDRYYIDTSTGDTHWDAPEGAFGGSTGVTEDSSSILEVDHVRSETVLPSGWGKDYDGDDKYYFNEHTGATSWEAPEGAFGGSTGL